MRITNTMLITNMLSNLNKNLNVMSRKQDELSTGKRIIFASDNPVGAAKIMKFKADIADMEQYSINTRDAQSWLDASESSVAEMGNILQRARELAVQAANGTNTVNDTTKIKEEIIQLRDHLISAGNASFAGRYQFSSFYTNRALLTTDGKYNIPITAEDILEKPVAVYEISSKEYMPVGTHGVEIFGYITDASAYLTNMPSDTMVKGVAAEKAAVQASVDFTLDYSAETLSVSVNGTAYNVDTTDLIGSALAPLDMQKVLDAYRNASAGPVKLSEVADVYFDSNKKLVVRNKTVGSGGSVQLNATAGLSNPANVTQPLNSIPLGAVNTVVSGIDAVKATVTGAGAAAPLTDFYNKSFVMTYNGITKVIQFPSAGALGAVQADVQTKIDAAFGAGKITVGLSPIQFETVTNPLDVDQPQLRIQPVVATESELVRDFNDFIGFLDTADVVGSGDIISRVDKHLQTMLAVRADIGARGSRLELVNARIAENSVTFTRLLSDTQDADMSEVIMHLKNSENVYKSALSVGGRIIQPSLIDFIR